jgi:hypothetical protein
MITFFVWFVAIEFAAIVILSVIYWNRINLVWGEYISFNVFLAAIFGVGLLLFI